MRRVKKTLKHIEEINRIASRVGRQTDQAAYELTSGVAGFMESLIASVEAGEDLETVIRFAREQVPSLWDKIDTSKLEERLVKVQHAALEAGGTPCANQKQPSRKNDGHEH